MSELQKGPAKITIMEEVSSTRYASLFSGSFQDTEDGDAGMTIKEIEEIKKKDKQRQQRNVICHERDENVGKKDLESK